ncbi:hypothetical protein ACTGXK_09240 [Streptococcus suis]|nr:hypothetical protein [Streptococcus suis]
MDLEELYENLSIEINNLKIRLDKNIFKGDNSEELKTVIQEFNSLCKSKKFNVLYSDIVDMDSFQKLLKIMDEAKKEYLINSIKWFYTEYIESIKDELY